MEVSKKWLTAARVLLGLAAVLVVVLQFFVVTRAFEVPEHTPVWKLWERCVKDVRDLFDDPDYAAATVRLVLFLVGLLWVFTAPWVAGRFARSGGLLRAYRLLAMAAGVLGGLMVAAEIGNFVERRSHFFGGEGILGLMCVFHGVGVLCLSRVIVDPDR